VCLATLGTVCLWFRLLATGCLACAGPGSACCSLRPSRAGWHPSHRASGGCRWAGSSPAIVEVVAAAAAEPLESQAMSESSIASSLLTSPASPALLAFFSLKCFISPTFCSFMSLETIIFLMLKKCLKGAWLVRGAGQRGTRGRSRYYVVCG
jgi:hypothetical protein